MTNRRRPLSIFRLWAGVAQLVRAPDCGSGGLRFNSGHRYQIPRIVKDLAHLTGPPKGAWDIPGTFVPWSCRSISSSARSRSQSETERLAAAAPCWIRAFSSSVTRMRIEFVRRMRPILWPCSDNVKAVWGTRPAAESKRRWSRGGQVVVSRRQAGVLPADSPHQQPVERTSG